MAEGTVKGVNSPSSMKAIITQNINDNVKITSQNTSTSFERFNNNSAKSVTQNINKL